MMGKYSYCFRCTLFNLRRGRGLCSSVINIKTCSQKPHFTTESQVSSSNRSSFQSNNNQMQVNGISNSKQTGSPTKMYMQVISALNSLQSRAATIQKSEKDPSVAKPNLQRIRQFLNCLEISQEDLKSLNAIHVAGTKGKGSTCAYTESILRTSGFQTGFFSSPHLVQVKERIRINGHPLSDSVFAAYFWQVHSKLKEFTASDNSPMPCYFSFLTVMALHIFLQEKVDVAIIEVGIGGEYDSTNVLESPSVVGLTSIGLDHVGLLGDTLEKIAWQKAGILKQGVPAFTVPQLTGVLTVFHQRAQEAQCLLYMSPNLSRYKRTHSQQEFEIAANIQEINITLALQLANAWIERHGQDLKRTANQSKGPSKGLIMAEPFQISEAFEHGVRNCVWLGRFQKVDRDKVTYFLDGAHTAESIESCSEWFRKSTDMESSKLKNRNNAFRVLIFNCTKDRKPEFLLPPLTDLYFDLAIFCTNDVHETLDLSSGTDWTIIGDIANFNADRGQDLQKMVSNLNVWKHLQSCLEEGLQYGTSSSTSFSGNGCESLSVPFVSETLACLEDPTRSQLSVGIQSKILKAEAVHVLVTGSLLLVGSVLSVIDPELKYL